MHMERAFKSQKHPALEETRVVCLGRFHCRGRTRLDIRLNPGHQHVVGLDIGECCVDHKAMAGSGRQVGRLAHLCTGNQAVVGSTAARPIDGHFERFCIFAYYLIVDHPLGAVPIESGQQHVAGQHLARGQALDPQAPRL